MMSIIFKNLHTGFFSFWEYNQFMRSIKPISSYLQRNYKNCLILILLINFCAFSCSKTEPQKNETPVSSGTSASTAAEAAGGQSEAELPDLAETIARLFMESGKIDPDRSAFVEDFWRWIFGEAGIPERIAGKVAASVLESPSFIMELLIIMQQDPFTFYLVDKKNPLPDGYEPEDLVPLAAGSYRPERDGLLLRKIAADALQEMAAAAAAEGITLRVGSTYRSAAYQAQVYERELKTYGKEIADRESAQPGKSQHQLGLTADFAPIDDAFAKTPASEWLLKNAGRFGWSLSFPDGYEDITGYRWESWHYRYVGRDLAAFINNYFEGIQQYALQFIHAWQKAESAG